MNIRVKFIIIEDEAKTASFLAKGLTEAGYIVDAASRGDDGLRREAVPVSGW
jgi:DNA-binding response OmpR family regulator